MPRTFDVEVIHIESLTPHALRVDIRRVDGESFTFRGGQFLMMHFEHEGRRMTRSYSVASPIHPEQPRETLELCIALVDGGVGTAIVRAWDLGTQFRASGPHGRFMLRPDEEHHLVLVGTGTGIAPYRAMRPEIEAALAEGRNVDLVFGARDESQFIYHEEWRELDEAHEGFRYWACASQAVDPERWAERGGVVGRVQDALDAAEHDVETTLFYLCGNESMVDDVTRLLSERGVEKRAVRTEAYVSPKIFGKKK